MAAAAPTAEVQDATPKPKGKKKLIIIVATAVLLLGGGGGAAVVVMKKRAAAAAEAAAAEEDGDGEKVAHGADKHKKDEHRTPPVFLPLEPFVVNLTDRDTDRFAQIGITLEMLDAKSADELKAYMPAIRNGILMVLSHKSSQELMEREGKEALQAEVKREALRPLGIEFEAAKPAEEGASGAKKKKKAAEPAEELPVKRVHFSSFIIQ